MIRAEMKSNGTVNIYTPYNRDFVRKIKGIGGARWNADAKAWNIPEDGLDTARKMMEEVYGETDLPSDEKTITVRIKFEDDYVANRGAVVAFGRTLAYAYGRDSGAKVGPDVILSDGEITSGGSAKYWATIIKAGAVFRLTIPVGIYEREKDKWNVEVVPEKEVDVRAQLIKEREKLLVRLAEIEKELGITKESAGNSFSIDKENSYE